MGSGQKQRVVAVVSGKGGTGKTTTAILLACAAAEQGDTSTVVDVDPQADASSLGWATEADAAGDPLPEHVTVVGVVARDLGRRLPALTAGADRVWLDTAPGDRGGIEAAIAAADLALVPCQPTVMDVRRAARIVGHAVEVGVPALVVLTRTTIRTHAADNAREALTDAGIAVAEATVPERQAVAQAYGLRPRPSAVAPFQVLYDEIKEL